MFQDLEVSRVRVELWEWEAASGRGKKEAEAEAGFVEPQMFWLVWSVKSCRKATGEPTGS